MMSSPFVSQRLSTMLKAMDEEDTEPMLRRHQNLGKLDVVQRYHIFVLSVQNIMSWVSFQRFLDFSRAVMSNLRPCLEIWMSKPALE